MLSRGTVRVVKSQDWAGRRGRRWDDEAYTSKLRTATLIERGDAPWEERVENASLVDAAG